MPQAMPWPSYETSEASAGPCALPITPGQDAESQVVALARGFTYVCLILSSNHLI